MAAADMVFYNGQVFTAEASQPRAQAIAVDDGRILQVGSDAAILALADASTQRIDLAGKVLMPGMIDTHSHPVMGALASLRANLKTDWAERESVRAQLRLMVRRILRKYKYPPDQAENAVELVLEQAQSLSEDWSTQN